MDAVIDSAPPARLIPLPGRGGAMAVLDLGPQGRPVDIVFSHANGFNALTYRSILQPIAASLRILAIDLRGHGASTLSTDFEGWTGWIGFRDDLLALLATAVPGPVVLAGHSRGGIVISQAAERAPDAIDALVYICALMLPDGMSRAEFKAMEAPNPAFDAIIIPIYDHVATIVDPTLAPAVFAQASPPDLVEAAMEQLVAEPHAPRSTKLRLTARRWGAIPRTYVECTADRTIPIASQRMMQELTPGARVVTLEADHSPFLSRPDELAEALLAVL